MQILPAARYLLHTCLSALPQEDLHSPSVWNLHILLLYNLQIPPSNFFVSGPDSLSLLACPQAPLEMPLLVFQLLHTWLSSSVVRNGCAFSQFSPFLLNT